MKKLLVFFLFFLTASPAYLQETAALQAEARKQERLHKDREALDIYRQIAKIEPTNALNLVKLTEVSAAMGNRNTVPEIKAAHFAEGRQFAQQLLTVLPNSAEGHYAMALALYKLTDTEPRGDSIASYIRQVKQLSEKAIALNAQYAKSYWMLGKWHLEMLSLPAVKKAALKVFYNSLPKPQLDSAVFYLEKASVLEPYTCPTALDLARAYYAKKRYELALQTLGKLAKLPVKNQWDAECKAEGVKLYELLN